VAAARIFLALFWPSSLFDSSNTYFYTEQTMKTATSLVGCCATVAALIQVPVTLAFVSLVPTTTPTTGTKTTTSTSSSARAGWLDKFSAFGSGASKESLDEQWEAQQEILRNRRKPQAERDLYFQQVEQRRAAASVQQQEKWSWQTKQYQKGEDPINEWKKRRADGTISDLDNQYGDPKKIGGIPLPMPSFGVGGEFGVGGKYDNGGRFDLRLPYADQGYVDEESDVMGKLGNWFGQKKKVPPPPPPPTPPNKKAWPW
jgi:hypothetical protein